MDGTTTTGQSSTAPLHAAPQDSPFCVTTELAFEQPELNQLRDVWYEKAAGRPIPYRSDFDARALKPVLRNIVILQQVLDGVLVRYRIRLMGSELTRLVGEGTGRFLDECVRPEAVPLWRAAYDAVMGAQAPLRIHTQYEAHRVNYLTSESFNAPMLDADGNASLLLSCAYFHTKSSQYELLG